MVCRWALRAAAKTPATALRVEVLAWQGSACVILDPKPSRALVEVVDAVDGVIWSIGGDRLWDALRLIQAS